MSQPERLTHIIHVIETQGRRYDWLADQIGVSKSHLAHTLAGRRPLSPQMATEIARVLGVPTDYILRQPAEVPA